MTTRWSGIAMVAVCVGLGCERREPVPPVRSDKVMKSDDEWRNQLTPEQFAIARKKGTERAFTGKYYDHKADGVYTCVCCGQALFSSEAKYDSGSGWPSFWKTLADSNVQTETDTSHGMQRTELRCGRCDAHLGHLFRDGPQPTGLRYCVNSASLNFVERK